jgi:hypothetical protein
LLHLAGNIVNVAVAAGRNAKTSLVDGHVLTIAVTTEGGTLERRYRSKSDDDLTD